ncbi:MAG TPA: S-adenosylmethionine:tRNA ribosyltransferase-isomerase [Acidobacteriota bacterium]|nr:S-adenosylmethionine:tRNA ribosyltransferase-isomerase [Acidobacteriota bacterium]
MMAASLPVQRPAQAKLLAVDDRGNLRHWQRSRWTALLRPGDLVIANDAATLPASLSGMHLASGRPVEVRLAGRLTLEPAEIRRFVAVVFGAGDFRVRTEDRPLPPPLAAGDRLALGPLSATVARSLNHPRLVWLEFDGSPDEILEGLARYGRPIQYSHVAIPLRLWDVWTPFAGMPVAFEPPSAGFALDWRILTSLRELGVHFATVTHAAGISSTGDPELDALLPLDEPYFISGPTAEQICHARRRRDRVIAVGTTVVRALESAADPDGRVRSGTGLATGRITGSSRLRVVNAIISGTHEPGTSHHELLHAFVDDATLRRMDHELNAQGYYTHEFGDSVFIERSRG